VKYGIALGLLIIGPPVFSATTDDGKPTDPTHWRIHETMDSFTNEKDRWATVQSLNTFEFAAPYQGQQHATLLFRSDLIQGKVTPVFRLFVERGQFLCGSVEICHVDFKYDNRVFGAWPAKILKDGSTNLIEFGWPYYDMYVSDIPICMVADLQYVNSLAVRAEFFQQGLRTFEFNIEGLKDLAFPMPTQKQLKVCGRSGKSIAARGGSTSGAAPASQSKTQAGRGANASRGAEEIAQVFANNQGAIDAMYARMLRDNPTLKGNVVVEVTIAPTGDITAARIVSGEFHNPEFESKVLARIRLFKFEAKDVPAQTATKSFDFSPAGKP
jgi:TonB family protein